MIKLCGDGANGFALFMMGVGSFGTSSGSDFGDGLTAFDRYVLVEDGDRAYLPPPSSIADILTEDMARSACHAYFVSGAMSSPCVAAIATARILITCHLAQVPSGPAVALTMKSLTGAINEYEGGERYPFLM